jgi:hypothetical protein
MNLDKDYIRSIRYTTDGLYRCEDSGCNDEGICRCFSITEVYINEIDINNITDKIFKKIFDIDSDSYKRDIKLGLLLNDVNIDKYGINRILTINELYEMDAWEPKWSSGYYGDEVDSIEIRDNYYNTIVSDIKTFISLESAKEKIEFLLMKEYGSILPKLVGKSYSIETLDKNDIIIGQKNYSEYVKSKLLDYYSDQNYTSDIRGVCLWNGSNYRLIDGYHRVTSTKKSTVKVIVAK